MNTKNRVLALLEEGRGKAVSGQDIARKLNISRSAVWKAVSSLKEEGYQIDSTTKLGHSLRTENDILSLAGMFFHFTEEFKEKYSEKSSIKIYQKVEGSTNTMAKELAMAGANHGTVIIANEQTSGRGRYGRSFFSPPNCGIYMSIVLDPAKIGYEDVTLITAYTAVAVCEAIETVCKKYPKIKWVNDLFLFEEPDSGSDSIEGLDSDLDSESNKSGALSSAKKICGISAEAVMDLESRNVQWIVVGIGINFTLPVLPPDLVPVVGAVFDDTRPEGITRNQLAAEVLNRMLNPVYSQTELIERYRQRLFILNKKIKIEGPTGPYHATALDIDEVGRLLIQNENNEIITLNAGEISVRLDN